MNLAFSSLFLVISSFFFTKESKIFSKASKSPLAAAGRERGKMGAPKAPDLSKEEIREVRSSAF